MARIVTVHTVPNYVSWVEGSGDEAREIACAEPVTVEGGRWRASFEHQTRGLYGKGAEGRADAVERVNRFLDLAGITVVLPPK